jgi:NADPH:quinone reductase-like Zn-dependent oxidoreductase
MRCIRAPKSDGVLVFEDEPEPIPGTDEVLMKVTAAGVNRLDILQKFGKYPVPPGESDILGVESAGIVEKVGENVTNIKVDDRVCALVGGGYAEKVLVPAGQLIPSPSSMTDEEACAIRMRLFGA